MKSVVTDTGPLLHLHEANAFGVLQLVGQIRIPPAVDEEMERMVGNESIKIPAWITTIPLIQPYDIQAETWLQVGLLDRGEAQAIALAQQIGADWFLTDDAAARLVAQSAHIEVHGSLGIVLWAAAAGHLDRSQAEATLKRLAESSLWITLHILEEARQSLKEMFL